MPAVAIVVSSVGASLGTAAFAGTALAAYGGMIGAGIAGGMMSMSQGGDFGKGFLMGAVGNFVGGKIGGLFGGAAEGLSEEAFDAADAASLMGTTDAYDNLLSAGAVGQNMGADAGNWSGINPAAITGDMSGGSAGLGEIIPDSKLTDYFGTPQADSMPVGYESGMGIGTNGEFYKPSTVQAEYSPWEPAGAQSSGVYTSPYSPAEVSQFSLSNDAQTGQPDVSTQPQMPGSNPSNVGLDNVTSAVAEPTASTTQPGFMDRMKTWVSDSDKKLGADWGLPKGSTLMGLAGIGQYMMGNYETYKAEQIAKGLRPLTLEEFQNKMYNANDYKQAANSMAKSGRTGTLPTLLARMKQQSSMDYTKNYQPTANQNWWNVNANISKQKMNNLADLTRLPTTGWAMNQGRA